MRRLRFLLETSSLRKAESRYLSAVKRKDGARVPAATRRGARGTPVIACMPEIYAFRSVRNLSGIIKWARTARVEEPVEFSVVRRSRGTRLQHAVQLRSALFYQVFLGLLPALVIRLLRRSRAVRPSFLPLRPGLAISVRGTRVMPSPSGLFYTARRINVPE